MVEHLLRVALLAAKVASAVIVLVIRWRNLRQREGARKAPHR